MLVTATALPEVLIIEPTVFGDDRGFFMESYNAREFRERTGVAGGFVQDNHSRSTANVLRGIHYQLLQPQGKLVRVTAGAVFDVAVDLRRSSVRFGQWVGVQLTAENKKQLWVPPGFGHGFLVLSDSADFLYKTTNYYHAESERCVRWDDPDIGINWSLPSGKTPILSPKDAAAPFLTDADVYE